MRQACFATPTPARLVGSSDLVEKKGVGTVCLFEGEVESLPGILNGAPGPGQTYPCSWLPTSRRGLAFRIREGVVPLPWTMAIGATRSESAARFAGSIAAREARALGVHWALAPVVDVNNNPNNPVINIRSFGEDPEMVARLGVAWIEGARAGGLLTTAKHFPGHGDTSVDTHLQIAAVKGKRSRLEAVELHPFRAAIAAGVDAVMVGHIAALALDGSGDPATLSRPIGRLLREGMGFSGIVVTDAMDMAGVKATWTAEATVRALEADADVVLLPPYPEVAVDAIVRAVESGRIGRARLDASVRRLLQAKARLGLHVTRSVDPAAASAAVDRPEDVARSLEIARDSITVVRNEGGILPLRRDQPLSLLHLVLSSDMRNPSISGVPEAQLARLGIRTDTETFGPQISPAEVDRLVALARTHTHVLASCFVRVTGSKGTADMVAGHARLLRRLAAAGPPVMVVSFGSPYLLRQFPAVPVYVAAYGSADSSQQAAIEILFGSFAAKGRLPVTLPGFYPGGHGLTFPISEMSGGMSASVELGGWGRIRSLIEAAMASKAFPGAVVGIAWPSGIEEVGAFGRLTYAEEARPVTADTLYDLASLTKVVATTSVVMKLVEEGKLDLAQNVSSILPAFGGGDKGRITVEHLLTHASGLPVHAPFYRDWRGREGLVERIAELSLCDEPGVRSAYSDVGFLLLGEIVEGALGERLEHVVPRMVLAPLGMGSTLYHPAPQLCGPDRSHRGVSLEGATADRGGARRERLRPRRRCGPRGPVRHRGRSPSVLSDDVAGWVLGGRDGLCRRDRPSLHPTMRRPRLDESSGLGYGGPRWRYALVDTGGSRLLLGGAGPFATLLRAHGLHGNVALDRPRARTRPRSAHQPGAPGPLQ